MHVSQVALGFLVSAPLILSGCGGGGVVNTTTTTTTTTPFIVHALGGVYSLAFATNSDSLIIGSGERDLLSSGKHNTLSLYNISVSPPVLEWALTNLSYDLINPALVSVSADGKWLAVATNADNSSARIYDVRTTPPVLYASFTPDFTPDYVLSRRITGIEFSFDSKWLAVVNHVYDVTVGSKVTVYDVSSKSLLWNSTSRDCEVGWRGHNAAFSSDSKLLAVGCDSHYTPGTLHSDNQTVQLYDMTVNPPSSKPSLAAGNEVDSIAFSSNGRWLAVGGNYHPNNIQLYDARVTPPALISSLEASGSTTAMIISGNSRWLGAAIASEVYVYDLNANPIVLHMTLQGCADQLLDVAFSHDSERIAVGGIFHDSSWNEAGKTCIYAMNIGPQLSLIV